MLSLSLKKSISREYFEFELSPAAGIGVVPPWRALEDIPSKTDS